MKYHLKKDEKISDDENFGIGTFFFDNHLFLRFIVFK
jgi:hypothetical protein